MVTAEDVKACLATLEPVHVAVRDISGGCGSSFEVVVVSPKFDGLPLLQRHGLVNTCLASLMGEIHAVTIKAWTEAVWRSKVEKGEA